MKLFNISSLISFVSFDQENSIPSVACNQPQEATHPLGHHSIVLNRNSSRKYCYTLQISGEELFQVDGRISSFSGVVEIRTHEGLLQFSIELNHYGRNGPVICVFDALEKKKYYVCPKPGLFGQTADVFGQRRRRFIVSDSLEEMEERFQWTVFYRKRGSIVHIRDRLRKKRSAAFVRSQTQDSADASPKISFRGNVYARKKCLLMVSTVLATEAILNQ